MAVIARKKMYKSCRIINAKIVTAPFHTQKTGSKAVMVLLAFDSDAVFAYPYVYEFSS